jgi:3-oxoacyl-[acyl-carrier-protein] synthase-1
MMGGEVFIADFDLVCALGEGAKAVASSLFATAPRAIAARATLLDGKQVPVGRVDIADMPGETRTNRIAARCLQALLPAIEQAKARYGAERLGVVIGTSTSGIGEGGEALKFRLAEGSWPDGFSLQRQQLGDTARFVAAQIGAEGPFYVVSTACSSGARAMASAARLIQADVCDAVLCGGADALCDLTLNGFAALDSLSSRLCNPMSANRNGLNIGEGAALFLLTREPGPYRLAGWGESVDGHHMSAPDPQGKGAESAMRTALRKAHVSAQDIDFVHLHGTATRLNDQMEAGVIARVFGVETACASTKPLTGHTLGAAGAVQAALCLLAMEYGQLPPHLWDGERDPELAPVRLTAPGEREPLTHILSASYAFGGNNAALVLAAS